MATNSDPTSGNALEQVPKWVLTLSAGTLLAEEPSVGSAARIAVAAAVCAAPRRDRAAPLGGHAPAARTRPRDARPPAAGRPVARRVYVIVVDGCNRGRLWQAHAPDLDRLAREGTEYLGVEPAYPARTVVCFSSMLTGAARTSTACARTSRRGSACRWSRSSTCSGASGRRGRLVGIAHLLDPFGEEVVRSVTSVQPTGQIDGSLTAAARAVVEDEDPDLLVLQLLAADQLGHVRGVRNPEYLDQIAETDRHVGDFLAFLGERGKLDHATVILMADHGQGRGIGGHGHLDWGERPVPFVVWGEGAVPGGVSCEQRSVAEVAVTISGLLGVDAPAAARGRPLVPDADPAVELPTGDRRCLAVVVARDEEPRLGAVLERLPATACGMPVDVLVVDDGSTDATAAVARVHGAEVLAHERSRGLGAGLRSGLEHARDAGYAAAVYLDGDGEYDAAELPRVLEPVARGRADYVCGSRFLGPRAGMRWHRTLANRGVSAILGSLLGGTVVSDGQGGFRAFSARALAVAEIPHDYNYAQVLTLSLWGARIDPVEVPISYTRRGGGRSFVRYPEYLARVAPAVWRQWRASRKTRATSAQPIPAASANGQALWPNDGNRVVSGPKGASGRGPTSPPSPTRTST